MKRRSLFLPLVMAAGLAGGAAQAQTRMPRIAAAPQPAAPAAATTSAFALPNPAGLTPPNPAGLTAGSAVSAPGDTPTAPTGTNGGIANAQAGAQVAGAGGVGSPRLAAGGTGGYAPVDIARSFLLADTNRDGELTRAEAARLTIAPYSFEEMDRNHDGILSRFEYEDATR